MAVLVGIALALGLVISPPASPPPEVGGTMGVGPPPAWMEDGFRSRWLAYGGYCWRTMCVDMLPPESQPELPRVRVAPGRVLRVHLAFEPARTSVFILRNGTSLTLRSTGRRTLSFRARRGILVVGATGSQGSTSYVARLV